MSGILTVGTALAAVPPTDARDLSLARGVLATLIAVEDPVDSAAPRGSRFLRTVQALLSVDGLPATIHPPVEGADFPWLSLHMAGTSAAPRWIFLLPICSTDALEAEHPQLIRQLRERDGLLQAAGITGAVGFAALLISELKLARRVGRVASRSWSLILAAAQPEQLVSLLPQLGSEIALEQATWFTVGGGLLLVESRPPIWLIERENRPVLQVRVTEARTPTVDPAAVGGAGERFKLLPGPAPALRPGPLEGELLRIVAGAETGGARALLGALRQQPTLLLSPGQQQLLERHPLASLLGTGCRPDPVATPAAGTTLLCRMASGDSAEAVRSRILAGSPSSVTVVSEAWPVHAVSALGANLEGILRRALMQATHSNGEVVDLPCLLRFPSACLLRRPTQPEFQPIGISPFPLPLLHARRTARSLDEEQLSLDELQLALRLIRALLEAEDQAVAMPVKIGENAGTSGTGQLPQPPSTGKGRAMDVKASGVIQPAGATAGTAHQQAPDGGGQP